MKVVSMALAAGLALLATVDARAQDAVLVIRHADKAGGDDPALTDKGREQAASWARMFKDAGIEAVFTSDARRTRETGGIIGATLGVPTVEIDRNDIQSLIGRVSEDHSDGVVLIVGHSETIPSILTELGHFDMVHVGASDFTSLFVVTALESDAPQVLRFRLP
ncbi:phosphoglycerate mutase family protein [Marimonas arenosa]|uniref:Histidine phosphatase family protein n=1 Tax=Marimonas arenosa TaxID=1795305 RepID=A0AAE3WE60_9RHOB|nr:phosphoglycerate mutase family protein [Marimonas arenosa]MDQ2090899.1 histidine phosphatase family protein [Marimonas arenosa]